MLCFHHRTSDLSFPSALSSTILIHSPLSHADYIGLPLSFLLSLITSIVDCPLHYLVADSLLLYPYCGSYHVRCIASQSSGTVGQGLCPLHLLTLLAQGCPAVYKVYYYSTWTLSLSFRAIETSEPNSKELHKLVDFPVSLLSAAA